MDGTSIDEGRSHRSPYRKDRTSTDGRRRRWSRSRSPRRRDDYGRGRDRGRDRDSDRDSDRDRHYRNRDSGREHYSERDSTTWGRARVDDGSSDRARVESDRATTARDADEDAGTKDTSATNDAKDAKDGERWNTRAGAKPKKRKGGGFKVKEKRRDTEAEGGATTGGRVQDRDRDRNRDQGSDRGPYQGRHRDLDSDRAATTKPLARRKPAAPPPSFMVVTVNDRLGTKASIPCLGTDLIRQFKVMVAARIGRQPGEIMLRRQGERPFKDQLTLDDYGVSNGVQLDLELDTGD